MKREELKITRHVGHNKQEVEISIEAERVFTIIDKTWSVDYATEEFEKQCNMSSKNIKRCIDELANVELIVTGNDTVVEPWLTGKEKRDRIVNEMKEVLRMLGEVWNGTPMDLYKEIIPQLNITMDMKLFQKCITHLYITTYIKFPEYNKIIITPKGLNQIEKFKLQDIKKEVDRLKELDKSSEEILEEVKTTLVEVIDGIVEVSSDYVDFDSVAFDIFEKVTDFNSDRQIKMFNNTLRKLAREAK